MQLHDWCGNVPLCKLCLSELLSAAVKASQKKIQPNSLAGSSVIKMMSVVQL